MALDKVIDSAVLDAGLTSVADAIRAKGGTSEQLAFPNGFVSAVEGIQAGGGADYLQYATGLNGFFTGATDLPENISIIAPNASVFYDFCFRATGVKQLTITANKITDLSRAFYMYGITSTLEVININADLSKLSSYPEMCRDNGTLREINTVFPIKNFSTKMFDGCTALEELRFAPNRFYGSKYNAVLSASSKLSSDTLVSLANAFVIAENAENSTITLNAAAKARCDEILGTVSAVTDGDTTYDFFTQDEAGTVTLTEFITTTKGWTLA